MHSGSGERADSADPVRDVSIPSVAMTDRAPSPPDTTEEDRPGGPAPVPAAELAEEFLARAVAAALADGDSWAQIGERLGVPTPHAAGAGAAPSDADWQNAIAEHENLRATRRHPPLPGTQETTVPTDDTGNH